MDLTPRVPPLLELILVFLIFSWLGCFIIEIFVKFGP
jgi:hypothetical protein